MYKQKLYMLLKALEVQEIEELMEKPSPYLVSVGLEIAKAARLGASLPAASEQARSSGAAIICGCNNSQWIGEDGICKNCAGTINTPPA